MEKEDVKKVIWEWLVSESKKDYLTYISYMGMEAKENKGMPQDMESITLDGGFDLDDLAERISKAIKK